MDPIVTAALAARTEGDVDQLEDLMGKAKVDSPRFLGDQEANWSSISSPADATSVLFERATNMFDAEIELEAERNVELGFGSPAEAAYSFFGVPRSGLGDLGAADREKLAAMSLIQVLDSDDSVRRPTLAFRDHGTGIATEDVPETILSLQGSNKLRKRYTHGVFGKGGSTACAFSGATVIVTRKQPDLLDAPEQDHITVAVVREEERDDMGLPYYRYFVGRNDDRLPYSVPASAHPDFQPGTYVAHINYLAGKMGLQNWTQEESVYAFAETILFVPVLPYLLQDARTDQSNVRPPERRQPSVLSGLGQRLETLKPDDGTIIDRSRWQTVPVNDAGDVRLRWWLFEDTDKRRTRVAKGFVVVFTTNGQVHHVWDNARLQQRVDSLRRVGQRLFVQVDCDGIELKKRYKVFNSFRAQVRRGPEGRALEDAVADALANDAELADHESELTRRSLRASGQSVSATFRKRLNRALSAKVPGLGPVAGKGTGPRPPRPQAEEDLYEEPTTMTGPSEIMLLVGGRATAFMQINAVDGFIPDVASISLEGQGRVPDLGVGDLRKGRLRLTIGAPASMAPGINEVDVVLTWLRKNGGLGRISWPVKVAVVTKIEPKPVKPDRSGKSGPTKERGEVAFIWQNGRDMGWDDLVVGDYRPMKGDDLAAAPGGTYADLAGREELIPTIVLNKDFAEWAGYLRSIARHASEAALETRRDRYGLAMGIIVANLVDKEAKALKKREAWEARQNGGEEPPQPMTGDQIRRALAEAAHGVVALMPDFDSLLGDLS